MTTSARLFTSDELPSEFTYPSEFLRLVNLSLVNLEPWYVLFDEQLRRARSGLLERYPGRNLVPFARRQDNDDYACWSMATGQSVLIIHDFASEGWELRSTFDDFNEWLNSANEDYIEFEP